MGIHVLDNGVCATCDDLLDEDSATLLQALNEMDGSLDEGQRAAFDPSKHLRNPKGSAGGGRFRSNVDKVKDAIAAHKAGTGKGHPLDGFDREQLRKVAKARGIELKRGEDRDSIAAKLLAHLGSDAEPKKAESKPAPNIEPKAKSPKTPKAAPVTEPIPNGHGGTVRPLKKGPGGYSQLTSEKAQAMQDEMHDPWTPEERAALEKYTGPGYVHINNALRGKTKGSKAVAATTADIRTAMGPTPRNVVSYRSTRPDAFGFNGRFIPEGEEQSLVGRTFHDPGFTSTSIAARSNQPVRLRISVPAGTKAAYVESLSKNRSEQELLLDAGTHFKITKAERDARGDTVLYVTVVGQDE